MSCLNFLIDRNSREIITPEETSAMESFCSHESKWIVSKLINGEIKLTPIQAKKYLTDFSCRYSDRCYRLLTDAKIDGLDEKELAVKQDRMKRAQELFTNLVKNHTNLS